MSQLKTVRNFRPSQNGFHFSNSFIDVPYDFKVLGVPIRSGHAYNGMCGGMIFAVCDLFYAGKQPPDDRFSPSKGQFFTYLCQRLIDSFALPFGPLKYYIWMNPTVKDTQVDPFQGAQAYQEALQKAGNQNYRVELIPGVDHNIVRCKTGCMIERDSRSRADWLKYAPEYLDLMEEWLIQLSR